MERNQQGFSLSPPLGKLTKRQVARLQADLIEMAHDAIIIRDFDSHILAWNQGAQDLYGWSEQEALGQITHELLHTRFPESREAVDDSLLQRGRWEGHLVHISRDGTPRAVDSRQALIDGNRNQSPAILEVNRDITMQMRLIGERSESQATVMALQETARQMDTFLGVISHELKSPLTAISGNVQLARRQLARFQLSGVLPAEADTSLLDLVKMLLERAERQVSMQGRLINDLIDSSRIQNNQLDLRLVLCNLVPIVEQVIEEQRSMLSSRGISWNTTVRQACAMADADRIGQVVSNYLSNALKYSPGLQPVVVSLERENEFVRVAVKDDGPGLSPEQQEQVWERFVRIKDIAVRSGSGVGLGLGLYICRSLIERHGGQTGVISQPGSGSTFWFTLPLAPSDGQE